MSTPPPKSYSLDDLLALAKLDNAITVPLHLFPQTDKEKKFAGFKVGIQVQVSIPVTESAVPPVVINKLFEFDTGGDGFWVDAEGTNIQIAYMPPDASAGPQTTAGDLQLAKSYGIVSNSYFSGIYYSGTAAAATVTFPEANDPGALSYDVSVGLVGYITNVKEKTPKAFPIFGKFYGDFGAALTVTPPNPTYSMMTALAQQPAGSQYNSFIVAMPPWQENFGNGDPVPQGYLIIGPSTNLLPLFATTFPLKSVGTYSPPPGTNTSSPAIYKETLITDATLTVTPAATASSSNPSTYQGIGVCFDTGAPITTLHPGSALPAESLVKWGDQFLLTAENNEGTQTLLDFTAGPEKDNTRVNNPHQNEAPSKNDSAGYVNSGLTFFLQNYVLYDLNTETLGVLPSVTS